MERFLGVKGWQTQEYFFGIIPLDEKLIPQINVTPETNTQNEVVKNNIVTEKIIPPIDKNISANLENTEVIVNNLTNSSKLQECKKCHNIISSDFDMCPYCFTQLIELEEGVDFVI